MLSLTAMQSSNTVCNGPRTDGDQAAEATRDGEVGWVMGWVDALSAMTQLGGSVEFSRWGGLSANRGLVRQALTCTVGSQRPTWGV